MKKRNGFAIIVVIVSLILIGNLVGMQNNSKKNTPESEKTSEINTTTKEETPVSSTQKLLHIRQIQIERHIQLHIQDRIMIINQKRINPVTATV